MLKTAESVTPKHPDKMCDQISDAILDWCLLEDENARVAIEVMGGHGMVHVIGEITMNESGINFFSSFSAKRSTNIRRIVGEITGDNNILVQIDVRPQSPYIKKGVDSGGAGDQGIMIGYACRENNAMIPQELYLARSLSQFLYQRYPNDGKTQVTLDGEGFIKTIVASFQYAKQRELKDDVLAWLHSVGKPQDGITIHANPAGDWNVGGFDADTGLTGRKLMVDNYGPNISVGGGAFSGKDCTKVDRSGAYMARKVACDMLRKYPMYDEAIVKIAYAIGIAEPVQSTATLIIDGKIKEDHDILNNGEWDLTPNGIMKALNLRSPIYQKTAEWGHFGNNFPWDN